MPLELQLNNQLKLIEKNLLLEFDFLKKIEKEDLKSIRDLFHSKQKTFIFNSIEKYYSIEKNN